MQRAIYLIFFNILGFFLFDTAFAAAEAPKNPNSAKACAICHYRWIDTFFIEGRGSDLVEYQSEKVVATREMCFSCHDGSVKDSRARANNDFGHKTNTPPPGHMQIPAIFPLDESGKMQCSTCHTAHGVPSGTGGRDTIFLRTSNRDSAMCRQCHPGMRGGVAAGNHPSEMTQQEIPGRLAELGAVAGSKKNQLICETCHTAHGSPYAGFLIENAGNSSLCIECHRDKDVFTPDGRKNPLHVINVRPEKAIIPQEVFQKGAKLGDDGVITCQTCHKIHQNRIEQQLLLIPKGEKSALCLTCHSDKLYLAETKHNLLHTAPAEKNLEGKTVAEAGLCSACHLPHKAARELSGEKDFTTQLCLSCHSKGHIAEKVNLSGNTHPLIVNPFEKKDQNVILAATDVKKEKLSLPLFNKYGVQDKNGNMTCATCHDPHGTQADVIAGGTHNGGGKTDKSTHFLRKPSPDVCRECHSNKFAIANSKHDLKKVAPTAENILRQTPSESGLCGSCHLVHGSQKSFLWARAAAVEGENLVLNMCLDCHNEKGIAREKIAGGYSHPLNTSLAEKGLSTSLPLFDLEGKIATEGVISCQTCHDPHRWDPVKTSNQDYLGGEGNAQNSFLRIENSPAPKLCENCHPDQAAVEKTDHDLTITAPFSKNIIGQTPAESGLCGVCHLVHNGRNQTKLWGQEFGRGDSFMETLCSSCHSQSGSAKDKIPSIASHPNSRIISLGNHLRTGDQFLPLFSETTGAPVAVGNISCPSCHNVHQWDPATPVKGAGVKVEGNATNSFLRTQSAVLMCKDCHGVDSLFKFKFYHDPAARKKYLRR